MKKILTAAACLCIAAAAGAQKYDGLIDKTVAVVGGEFIMLSDIEQEVQMMRANGYASDKNMRCDILENILESKMFLMQAKVDSLTINQEMVMANLNQRMDAVRTSLGGDDKVEEYFGKSVYKLRQEWQQQLEDMSLTQQEQMQIAKNIPEVSPFDVKTYVDTADVRNLPEIPAKYQMSQICIYPDREKAKMEAKDTLLALRERIMAGEKFSTLARLYSQDLSNARKGGELGMAAKGSFWPAFSDAAMALKPGMVSNVVETPDGFHIIQLISKKGDMFNARHILIKPEYTAEDRTKGFKTLDSLRTQIDSGKISFETAARMYSQDPATRTNGGQMADINTGSSYFEIDQLKPSDYLAIRNLKEGEISEPVESMDNEGRGATDRNFGNTVYKIIRLDRIIPSHTANFEKDYNVLFEQVQMLKQNEAIDKFLEKKISETKIIIDPLFADCEFKRAAWAEKVRK